MTGTVIMKDLRGKNEDYNMTIWFTGDTHFGHKAILKLGNRPFDSIEEMDEAIIASWNSRIKPTDDVYHLGDVSFYNPKKTAILLSRLNGCTHVIAGNHDKKALKSMLPIGHFTEYVKIRWNRHRIILSHYPFRVWDGCNKGYWHLHGHCHGNLRQAPHRIYDVGVDNNNYAPICIEELETRMVSIKTCPQEDHHANVEENFAEEFGKLCTPEIVLPMLRGLKQFERKGEMKC